MKYLLDQVDCGRPIISVPPPLLASGCAVDFVATEEDVDVASLPALLANLPSDDRFTVISVPLSPKRSALKVNCIFSFHGFRI